MLIDINIYYVSITIDKLSKRCLSTYQNSLIDVCRFPCLFVCGYLRLYVADVIYLRTHGRFLRCCHSRTRARDIPPDPVTS